MLEKCACQHCGQHIEFEVEHANQFCPCPNCGKQTRLLLMSAFRPPAGFRAGPKAAGFDWRGLAIIIAIVTIIVALITWKYQAIGETFAQVLGLSLSAGAAFIALIVGIFAIILAFMWTIFPVIVWKLLREIRDEIRAGRLGKSE